tara:strand:- start:558 stop:809 length:252 start_codon:yes stop_codon:yes gene_type:complete
MSKYKKHTKRFVGDHHILKYGEHYTMKEYAKALGISIEAMRNRVGRYEEVTNVALHPYSIANAKRCETKVEVFSQKWLRKKLI